MQWLKVRNLHKVLRIFELYWWVKDGMLWDHSQCGRTWIMSNMAKRNLLSYSLVYCSMFIILFLRFSLFHVFRNMMCCVQSGLHHNLCYTKKVENLILLWPGICKQEGGRRHFGLGVYWMRINPKWGSHFKACNRKYITVDWNNCCAETWDTAATALLLVFRLSSRLFGICCS